MVVCVTLCCRVVGLYVSSLAVGCWDCMCHPVLLGGGVVCVTLCCSVLGLYVSPCVGGWWGCICHPVL